MVKFIETESIFEISTGGGKVELLLNGYRVFVWSHEKFLEILLVIVAQYCECH